MSGKLLTSLSDINRIAFSKFRCRSSKLPVVNSVLNVDDVTCLCKLCDLNETGDEFHYIMKCPFFSNDRKRFLKINDKKINCLQFKQLFTENGLSRLKSLTNFIHIILNHFKSSKIVADQNTQAPLYLAPVVTRSGRASKRPQILDL